MALKGRFISSKLVSRYFCGKKSPRNNLFLCYSLNNGYNSRQWRSLAYTSESYPDLKRSNAYGSLIKDDIEHFLGIVGNSGLIYDATGQDESGDMNPFNVDWMRKYRGKSQLVLQPRNAEQVSEIMKHCNSRKLAVVPQGGNTGLVGGGVPVFDEIVISTRHMNKIRSFDDVSGILSVDAGVILEIADQYLAKKDYIFPLDLGAKGSCHVGGNLATNAGGLRLLRYGSLHGSVLGLEIVLADGRIINNMSSLRKDNTGFDLKQLFIGSEGTIGIITGATILCPRRSSAINVGFFGVNTFEQVQQAFVEARKGLGEILSAFEFMDSAAHSHVLSHSGKRQALDDNYNFYVLIETSGSNKDHDDEKLENFLETALENGTVIDGVVAQDSTQAQSLWSLRESIPEALSKVGGTYKYDVSIPLKSMYSLVEDVRKVMDDAQVTGEGKNVVDVVGYGHIGDGNLHLNVAVKKYDKTVEKLLEPFVYEWIAKHQGSVSAEHGIGLAKKPFIGYSKSPIMLDLIRYVLLKLSYLSNISTEILKTIMIPMVF